MSLIETPSRPRVVLLTSPGLYGAEIINALAGEAGLELVGIGLTDRVFKKKGLLATGRTLVQRTGFDYTSYSFWVSNFAWTWLRMTGRPTGLACVGSQVRYLKDVNAADSLDWMRMLQPDFVASFYFNQWIGADVRSIPARGCVNLHPSLLPALRGPDPIFRTLERRHERTGMTIHTVADSFDAGPILHQEERPIEPGTSVCGLYLQMARGGAQVLAEWLSGKKPGVPPAPGSVAMSAGDDYTTFPTAAEVRAFRKSGQELLGTRELFRAIAAVR